MGLFKTDHIPTMSLVFIGFMAITALFGITVSIFNRRIFRILCVFSLLSQGIITIVKPTYSLPRSPDSVKLDGLHQLLARSSACLDILFSVLLWLTIRIHDSTPRMSLLWSCTVGLILKALARVYLFGKIPVNSSGVFTEQEICDYTTFACDTVWLILIVFHLFTTSSWGGYAGSANRINFHLRVDNFALLVTGMAILAFPQWIVRDLGAVERLDKYHVYLAQLYAGKLITLGLIAGRAVHYISNNDKATYLGARIAFCIGFFVLNIYSRHASDGLKASPHLFHAVSFACLALNAVAGYTRARFPTFPRFHDHKSD